MINSQISSVNWVFSASFLRDREYFVRPKSEYQDHDFICVYVGDRVY